MKKENWHSGLVASHGWHGGPALMAHGLAPSAQHGSLLLDSVGSTYYSTRSCWPNSSFIKLSHRPKWAACLVGQVYNYKLNIRFFFN